MNEQLPDEHEVHAKRIAFILGDFSSAAFALRNLAERRQAGEDAVIWLEEGTWIVGPRPGPTGRAQS